MKLDDAITKRRSVRSFSSKKVKWAHVLEAIEAANQAPFAGNINQLKFIMVQDPNSISKLADHTQQDWIEKSSIVVVICSQDNKLVRTYHDRGTSYAKQQTGAAIENFLLKITDMGLATCWIGAYDDNKIKSLLKIPEENTIEAVLPIGYELGKTKASKKEGLENVIYWEKWDVRKKPTKFQDATTMEISPDHRIEY